MSIERNLDLEVGNKFLAFNNSDLIRSVTTAFGADVGDTVKVLRSRNGAGVVITADMRDLAQDVPELGGRLVPRLFLRNANDGSSALHVGVGIFRLICTNGLTVTIGDSSYDIVRHVNGPKANEYLDVLPDLLMRRVGDIQSGAIWDVCIEAKEQRVLDPIDVIASLPNVSATVKHTAMGLIANGLTREQDAGRDAWSVYNLVNEVARRRGRSLYRAASNDIGLLDHVMALAEHQRAKAA